MSILELNHISYSYERKGPVVLQDISYSFEKGKLYAITGRSGAGKSTLLSLISGLALPTEGKILLKGQDITSLNRYEYRSHDIGVIFQSFNLLPKLTALENVLLSMDISGCKYEDKKAHAMELLKKVDIGETEANRRILKLSGGQQQRVAIARALSYGPEILVADEPTGNLDPETQEEIMKIFLNLAHKDDCCVIIVTHSREVAKAADQVYRLEA
ncbi:MAG: ABC transporter ATP-binding protein [Blautia sp.]